MTGYGDPEGHRCGVCMQLCKNSRELRKHERDCERAEMAERALVAWPAMLAERKESRS